MATETGLATIEEMPQWRALEPAALAGTVLVIGASDSGKTTLVRWLADRLAGSGKRAAWLDADIGQSTLGLPAAMHLAFSGAQPNVPPPAAFFVGGTTPRGRMLPILVGLFRLRERALAAGAQVVLVDTSGLVEAAAGGGALKEWEIELLRPGTVIAVQRERELDHLLGPLRRRADIRLHILPASPHARSRSQAARRARRERQFRDYFAAARSFALDVRPLPIYGVDRIVPGRLLGILDREGFALATGVLHRCVKGWLEIAVPLQGVAGIAAVRLGEPRIDAVSGKELMGQRCESVRNSGDATAEKNPHQLEDGGT